MPVQMCVPLACGVSHVEGHIRYSRPPHPDAVGQLLHGRGAATCAHANPQHWPSACRAGSRISRTSRCRHFESPRLPFCLPHAYYLLLHSNSHPVRFANATCSPAVERWLRSRPIALLPSGALALAMQYTNAQYMCMRPCACGTGKATGMSQKRLPALLRRGQIHKRGHATRTSAVGMWPVREHLCRVGQECHVLVSTPRCS